MPSGSAKNSLAARGGCRVTVTLDGDAARRLRIAKHRSKLSASKIVAGLLAHYKLLPDNREVWERCIDIDCREARQVAYEILRCIRAV